MKEKGEKMNISDSIEIANGSIVSKQIIKKETGNITLFAFSKGEGLSEHTSPYDAFINVVQGTTEISIGGKVSTLTQGEGIVLPANIPHAVKAVEDFKMMLVMIK